MKIKITYTEAEKGMFERVRSELIQTVPGQRTHESTAPGGRRVWYLTSRKKQDDSSQRTGNMV